MVSIGSKALLLRRHSISADGSQEPAEEDTSFNQRGKKRKMGRKTMRNRPGFDANPSADKLGSKLGETGKFPKSNYKNQKSLVMPTSFVRFDAINCLSFRRASCF